MCLSIGLGVSKIISTAMTGADEQYSGKQDQVL